MGNNLHPINLLKYSLRSFRCTSEMLQTLIFRLARVTGSEDTSELAWTWIAG